MKNRLEIAKELLSDDGSVWINLDDNEAHYCKVLCDEVFGRENFIADIIWQKKHTRANDAKYFSDNHDHVLCYTKIKESWKRNLLERTEEANSSYSNPDNDPRGVWQSSPLQAKSGSDENFTHIFKNGVVWSPPKGRFSAFSHQTLDEMEADNRIWFGKDGANVPRYKKFLSETQNGLVPVTIWLNEEVGHNQEAKDEIKKLNLNSIFSTPKPERLIQRIIQIATNPNDIVLDFCLGSGTTCAVAHKMERRWIGIEQMDYIEDITKVRLQKVLDGEQGGISKAVNWQGGGSFVYFELKKYNQYFVEKILQANNMGELDKVYDEMAKNAFFKFWYDKKEFEKSYKKDKDDNQISLDDRKKMLIEILDENQLYLNYADMDDSRYQVSDDEKALTQAFYGA